MKPGAIIAIIGIVALLLVGILPFFQRSAVPPPTANANTNATPPPTGKENLIRVSSPLPNAVVASPLGIMGEARGYWFFEASFPVRIYDANGVELGVVPAQAIGEWMTEDFVPFSATLPFTTPTTATGTLVLEKDNPSGLPEHDDQLRIPVRFAP